MISRNQHDNRNWFYFLSKMRYVRSRHKDYIMLPPVPDITLHRFTGGIFMHITTVSEGEMFIPIILEHLFHTSSSILGSYELRHWNIWRVLMVVLPLPHPIYFPRIWVNIFIQRSECSWKGAHSFVCTSLEWTTKTFETQPLPWSSLARIFPTSKSTGISERSLAFSRHLKAQLFVENLSWVTSRSGSRFEQSTTRCERIETHLLSHDFLFDRSCSSSYGIQAKPLPNNVLLWGHHAFDLLFLLLYSFSNSLVEFP